MDETFMLGRGKFLEQKGFEPRVQIFLRHLQKVTEVAGRYGFTVHMWSDMFFRSVLNGRYYAKEKTLFPKEIIEGVPAGVELVYWDYDHEEQEWYDIAFDSHAQFRKKVWFAGGVWSWVGFAPCNSQSLRRTKAAMQSVRANGIEDILITMWGDDGAECSCFATLPVLYAARQYADGNFDDEKVKQGFYELFKIPFDDFMSLELPDDKMGLSKVYLYNDLFLGIFDKEAEKRGLLPYEEAANALWTKAKRAGEFGYIFNSQAKLCRLVAKKYDLGIKIRKAYRSGDREKLAACVKEISSLERKLSAFHKAFYTLWMKENKPHGWEIQDARLGGVLQRMKTCKMRLNAYLYGGLEKIKELEEEILDYNDSVRYGYVISRNLL